MEWEVREDAACGKGAWMQVEKEKKSMKDPKPDRRRGARKTSRTEGPERKRGWVRKRRREEASRGENQ
eukprot:4145718-Pleurochrysis_carterae.AAC.1